MEHIKKNVAMPTDLKTKNRKRILGAFRETGGRQVTLNEISNITGISRQTIMKSMGFFLDKGIIQSLGKGSSSEVGGKRPELYRFNTGYKYVICARLGHKSLLVAIINLSMEIVDVVSMEHAKNEKLDVIMERFTDLYGQLLEKTGITEEQIIGAGICLGGICNQTTGIMRYNSVYPSWGRDIPIVDKFRACLPEHFVMLVTNETKLTAMAELYYQPELKDKRVVVILTHGGGISAAYVNKSKVVDGANALAGEIGHMTVDPYSQEVCDCGLKGCLEKVVAEDVLLRRIKQGLAQQEESILADIVQSEYYKQGEVVKSLAAAADIGDKLALEVTDYMARFMSIGLKNIILNNDPECIIIQGYHTNNGTAYKQALQKYLAEFKYFPDDIDYEISYDKREVNQLAIVGTGYTLLERYFAGDELYSD